MNGCQKILIIDDLAHVNDGRELFEITFSLKGLTGADIRLVGSALEAMTLLQSGFNPDIAVFGQSGNKEEWEARTEIAHGLGRAQGFDCYKIAWTWHIAPTPGVFGCDVLLDRSFQITDLVHHVIEHLSEKTEMVEPYSDLGK